MGDAPIDSTFPAVARLSTWDGGCSGTFVGPNVLLTAAHCFSSFGEGCITAATNVSFARVNYTKFGDPAKTGDSIDPTRLDDFQFAVRDVIVHPKAFPSHDCPPLDQGTERGEDVDSAYDVALVRIEDPISVSVASMATLTSADGRGSYLDTKWAFGGGGGNYTPHIVGFGVANAPGAQCQSQRRSAIAKFDPTTTWLQKNADGSAGKLNIQRATSTSPFVASGDSGGPLVVHGDVFRPFEPHPSEAGGGWVVIGVMSRTTEGKVGCGDPLPSWSFDAASYAALFLVDVGSWVDTNVNAWVTEYQAAHTSSGGGGGGGSNCGKKGYPPCQTVD